MNKLDLVLLQKEHHFPIAKARLMDSKINIIVNYK